MSDYQSALPIRSQVDGADERVQTKVVDAQNPDTQQMEVDSDNNAHVEVHGNQPTGDDVVLQLSQEGRPNPRGDYDGTTNSKPASSALIAHERNGTKNESHQNKRISAVDSSVNSDVTALDVAIRDESGNPYTQDNPLPVSLEESEGDEIADPDQSVNIAADASSNHDYTVTAAKNLVLDSIWCTASGKAKFELQIEDGPGVGTFTSVAWSFNSTANPNVEIPIRKRITVSAGVIVRVVKTNRDNQPQDLYTTIFGVEK